MRTGTLVKVGDALLLIIDRGIAVNLSGAKVIWDLGGGVKFPQGKPWR